ncbi:MAG: S8 family serine peptidase [Oscillospiraceae bacterium]|nr:S8 family serine peptidase [Oscillospiraceae bacterium]
MNRTYWKRACSFAAAIVLACSSIAGGGMLPASAITPESAVSTAETAAVSDETPVPVIVTLEAEALLADGRQADYLCTPEAAAQSEAIRAGQEAVIAQMTALYPALTVDYRFLTLTNGFSCMLPEYLIAQAETVAGVQSVTRSVTFDPVPEAAESLELGNIPSFISETDCRGEGKVIAVIDTELNLSHPMFSALPDSKQTKLSKEKVQAISSAVGFHVSVNADDVYYSSKVPFAADYLDSNPRAIENQTPAQYHGSHVAGIAAGNAYQTNDGELISGVAPDAQLVFMAIDGEIFDESVFLAALEDAVKLQADAANISLGNSHEQMEEDDPFCRAVNAAEAAGVTVCVAAGNDSNGSELGFEATPDNPDSAEMNMLITEQAKALAVASAEGTADVQMYTLSVGGTVIPYTGYVPSDGIRMNYLRDVLGEGSYDFVYCGLGTAEDFAGKDLTGRLVLVERGLNTFTEKAENAKNAGALGVICMQNTDEPPINMASDSTLPIGMVSKADGEKMRNAAHQTLFLSDNLTTVHLDASVSPYTGWGVHSSLDLRPDIMGIGGNVRSAAYSGDVETMSGTSMASPYIAGCAVLLGEYLDKSGCTLTGSAREQRIRNLLMTGAVPFEEDGMPVTPRRQGAGMVSMTNAMKTKVLLTGESGETKLNLRDQLGTEFDFDVTLTNISDEDVHFRNARLVLTTDRSYYDSYLKKDVIRQQQLLNCEADVDGLLDVPADRAFSKSVHVTLDRQQVNEIRGTFVNGFFIEGYLYLEGADNTVDISIPLLGFSDDFSALPIFGDNYGGYVSWFDYGLPGYDRISDQLDRDSTELGGFMDDFGGFMSSALAYSKRHQTLKNRLYISPNDDGLADYAGIRLAPQRDCFVEGGDLLDSSGKCAAKGFRMTEHATRTLGVTSDAAYSYSNIYGQTVRLNDLPEGDYTLQVRAGATKERLKNAPEIAEVPVTIDKTAPKVKTELIDYFGRTILRLTAEDKYLDSIMLIGKGSGRLVTKNGIREPEKYTLDDLLNLLVVSAPSVGQTMEYGCAFRNWYNAAVFDAALAHENPPEYEAMDNHTLGRFIYDGGFGEEWDDHYDFTSFLTVEPDQNGSVTLEYDVTDLEWYSFTAADRAFNLTEVNYVDEQLRPASIEPGVYLGTWGYYEFTEDHFHYEPLAYNIEPFDCDYTLELRRYDTVMHVVSAESEPFWFDFDFMLTGDADTSYRLDVMDDPFYTEGNGFESKFNVKGMKYDTLVKTDFKTLNGFLKLSAKTAEQDYVKPLMKELTGCVNFDKMTYRVDPDAVVTFTTDCCDKRWQIIERVSIKVDLRTGIATLPDGTRRQLLLTGGLLGDTDCSSNVDVSDAVLLAKFLVSDRTAVISEAGLRNADCNRNGSADSDDLTMLLQAIARIIKL